MAVRKTVVTISSSNGSSTMSKLADVQYTGYVTDDTESRSAPLPLSVAMLQIPKADQMIRLCVFP